MHTKLNESAYYGIPEYTGYDGITDTGMINQEKRILVKIFQKKLIKICQQSVLAKQVFLRLKYLTINQPDLHKNESMQIFCKMRAT